MISNIVHVGIHKTGSSFLQRRVFPHLQDAVYNGPDCWRDDSIKEMDRQLRFWNPLYVDTRAWAQTIAALRVQQGKRLFFYSQESLVGRLLDGYRDHESITILLKRILGEAKVLIVFRRQDTWIESAYRQTLHLGFSVTPEAFLQWRHGKFYPVARPSYMALSLNAQQLDWSLFVENYQRYFGEANVLALPYELMQADLVSFLDHFYAFAGFQPFHPEDVVYENRGYSPFVGRIAYQVNRLVLSARSKRVLRRLFQERIDRLWYQSGFLVPEDLRRSVLSLYIEQNQKLQRLCGFDLAQFGYY
jgi:hypothetical protein